MNTQSRVLLCAACGAILGAAGGYLFYTPAGRTLRDRIEPAVDEMRRELLRFQSTIAKVGDLANDGLRMVNEFNQARARSGYPSSPTSH